MTDHTFPKLSGCQVWVCAHHRLLKTTDDIFHAGHHHCIFHVLFGGDSSLGVASTAVRERAISQLDSSPGVCRHQEDERGQSQGTRRRGWTFCLVCQVCHLLEAGRAGEADVGVREVGQVRTWPSLCSSPLGTGSSMVTASLSQVFTLRSRRVCWSHGGAKGAVLPCWAPHPTSLWSSSLSLEQPSCCYPHPMSLSLSMPPHLSAWFFPTQGTFWWKVPHSLNRQSQRLHRMWSARGGQ